MKKTTKRPKQAVQTTQKKPVKLIKDVIKAQLAAVTGGMCAKHCEWK